MKKYTLALLCSAALIPAANAADLSRVVKAPVMAPAPVNWTGFYIGGNVGWAHSNFDVNSFTATPGGALGGAIGTVSSPGQSFDDDSFTGGGQIGYNWQIGQTVLGLEGDFNGLDAKADTSDIVDQGPLNGVNVPRSVKADWFATVRGRLGYAVGRFLPYVTGGLAIMHSKVEVSASGTVGAPAAPLSYAASDSQTVAGYAVGAGVEYAIARNWSVKAEYLHMGFGSQDYDLSGNFTAGATVVPVKANASVNMDFDIARVGLNYRF